MSAPTRSPANERSTPPGGPSAHPAEQPRRRSGRWIDHWDPEDPTFWHDGGRRVASRNLWISILAEFVGFAVWALWSIVVPHNHIRWRGRAASWEMPYVLMGQMRRGVN